MKIKILLQHSPAGKEKGQQKAGQYCNSPEYFAQEGSIGQMRPSMQSSAVAKMQEFVRHPPNSIPQLLSFAIDKTTCATRQRKAWKAKEDITKLKTCTKD